MTGLAFTDIETTSLERPSSPTPGEAWEIATIVRRPTDLGLYEVEYHWLLPVTLDHANPESLRISRFHERHPAGDHYTGDPANHVTLRSVFVQEFQQAVAGCHLVGAVPSFDEERIAAIFHSQGHTGPFPWHYHVIDVEGLAAGKLLEIAARAITSNDHDTREWARTIRDIATPPYDSDELSWALGINLANFDRHTAIGDSRWAMAIYDDVYGQP